MGYDRERITLVLNRADTRVGHHARRRRGDHRPRARRARPERPGRSRARSTRRRRSSLAEAAVGGAAKAFRGAGRRTYAAGADGQRPKRPSAARKRCSARRALMELHERLATARPVARTRPGRDPFAEVKNRIHLAVIGELGPQLFNVDMDPIALRERVIDRHPRRSSTQETGISRDDRERLVGRDRGRHPRPRPARAPAGRRQRHGDHGQRRRSTSGSSARAGSTRRPSGSTTSRTCAGSSTRWSRRSGAASTSPRRWSTPACPTAAASTPSSRRSR